MLQTWTSVYLYPRKLPSGLIIGRLRSDFPGTFTDADAVSAMVNRRRRDIATRNLVKRAIESGNYCVVRETC